jgi:hypothetical protein
LPEESVVLEHDDDGDPDGFRVKVTVLPCTPALVEESVNVAETVTGSSKSPALGPV